ncbi:hypothetical protein Q5752_006580 [Cryptotrichosporon argae]
MSSIKTRSAGPADPIDLDHPVPPAPESLAGADFEREIAFYASYHSNRTNQLIHFIFIPQILWSWMILLAGIALSTKPYMLIPGLIFQPSAALLWALAYNGYYIYLDLVAGSTYIPQMTLMYFTATYLRLAAPAWLPLSTALTAAPSAVPFALAVFFNGWAWQFFGHFAFEGRAPALTESFTQALVTAPYFAHLEMLFSVFDFRPDLHKRIVNRASLRIAAMNRAKRGKAD